MTHSERSGRGEPAAPTGTPTTAHVTHRPGERPLPPRLRTPGGKARASAIGRLRAVQEPPPSGRQRGLTCRSDGSGNRPECAESARPNMAEASVSSPTTEEADNECTCNPGRSPAHPLEQGQTDQAETAPQAPADLDPTHPLAVGRRDSPADPDPASVEQCTATSASCAVHRLRDLASRGPGGSGCRPPQHPGR